MSKRKIYWIIIFFAILSVGLFAYLRLTGVALWSPKNYVQIKNNIIAVEIADSPASQARGLSNRPSLSENQGMLFIFPDRQTRIFWMKKMLFPLDIIWLDGNRIVKISANLPAEGLAPAKIYSSDTPVNYVLEVNAGWAKRAGVKVGELIEYHL